MFSYPLKHLKENSKQLGMEGDLWQWHVNMTGMEVHLQTMMLVLMLARIGDAME